MVICYGSPRNRTCIISLERFQPNFPSVYSVLRGLLIVSQAAQLPWFRPHLPAPRRLRLEFSLQFPSWGATSVFSNPRPEPQPRRRRETVSRFIACDLRTEAWVHEIFFLLPCDRPKIRIPPPFSPSRS